MATLADSWERRRPEGLLPRAKELLVQRYVARRVILFGSFARGTATERRDVDLAVAGMQPLGYLTALADLAGVFDSPKDLVEIERAPPSMLARLEFEVREL